MCIVQWLAKSMLESTCVQSLTWLMAKQDRRGGAQEHLSARQEAVGGLGQTDRGASSSALLLRQSELMKTDRNRRALGKIGGAAEGTRRDTILAHRGSRSSRSVEYHDLLLQHSSNLFDESCTILWELWNGSNGVSVKQIWPGGRARH